MQCNESSEWQIYGVEPGDVAFACTRHLSAMVSDTTTVIEPFSGEETQCCFADEDNLERIQNAYTNVAKWNAELREENIALRKWVSDLQSGQYVNCVYCGHRYGPRDNTPVSQADLLTQHIEQCPKHPLSRAVEHIELLNNTLRFHPRAAKLMRKQKQFVVVAIDEPYFAGVYETIRLYEIDKGTWTESDEAQYQKAIEENESDFQERMP